jgi:hypothetical protein
MPPGSPEALFLFEEMIEWPHEENHSENLIIEARKVGGIPMFVACQLDSGLIGLLPGEIQAALRKVEEGHLIAPVGEGDGIVSRPPADIEDLPGGLGK